MLETTDKVKDATASTTTGEVRLRGNAVSRGTAIAPIQIVHGVDRQFFRRTLRLDEIEDEIDRLRRSFSYSREQLTHLAETSSSSGQLKDILSTQLMMLDDPVFSEEIESSIREQRVNAEWATMSVVATKSATLRSLADQGLRERHVDVEDVGERILTALSGDLSAHRDLEADAIILASELRPSTLAAMEGSFIKGIVTEHGGWTSHTFILAREMGIPAVTGVRDLLRHAKNGDVALIDGDRGDVVLAATDETIKTRSSPGKARIHPSVSENGPGSVITLDGREIKIKANIDFPSLYPRALDSGARGIGLYRSEFLLDRFRALPTEEEQFQAYREIVAMAGDAGANIRTFDVGIRRLPEDVPYRERNAALGLRAIRLSLTREEDFRDQIRALLRAAAAGDLRITLPMVSGVGEVRKARLILDDEKANLAKAGVPHGDPLLGAMVEVPSTIFMIEELVEVSDFICLGTNDLVQYMLAVDRDNELVAGWFNTLHPSIIRAVRTVVEACSRANKPLTVCGEMAASPYYTPVLIGLGAAELSMNLNAISRVREVLGGISFADAKDLAEAAEHASTSEESEAILLQHIAKKWAHLYPERP